MKKMIAILLVAVMLFTLCACDNPLEKLFSKKTSTKSIKGMSAEEAIRTVFENQENIKSVRISGEMAYTMEISGMDLSFKTVYEGESTTDPNAFHLKMTVDTGGFGDFETESYAVPEKDHYTTYTNIGGNWSKQTVKTGDYKNDVDSLIRLDEDVAYTEVGKEEINGVKTIHYAAAIEGDKLGELLGGSGALELFSALGLDPDDAAQFADLEDLKIDVWASEKDGLMVRYSMDMSALMSALLEKASAAVSADVRLTEAIISIDFSDYNNVTVTVPKDVIKEAD